ncbi:unnamed protein product [Prorocentrum cordatum]|uniref:Separase n=1 Tax=Prorocentrum cordatum TaxID=2364126 RepID=A0ABN9YAY1_9DINO|nr:unnamed protein product [Polarella glacialis]
MPLITEADPPLNADDWFRLFEPDEDDGTMQLIIDWTIPLSIEKENNNNALECLQSEAELQFGKRMLAKQDNKAVLYVHGHCGGGAEPMCCRMNPDQFRREVKAYKEKRVTITGCRTNGFLDRCEQWTESGLHPSNRERMSRDSATWCLLRSKVSLSANNTVLN